MEPLIDINVFIKIFSCKEYRKKLDQIILNFFGLENKNKIANALFYKEQVSLEIIVFINKSYILKIVIKDNKSLFKENKKFYINFSYEKTKRNYVLRYPCYWEFYCENCMKSKKYKDLEYVAAILYAQNLKQIEKLFNRITVFKKSEIKNIINIIKND